LPKDRSANQAGEGKWITEILSQLNQESVGGNLAFGGMRITVQDVLSYLAAGMTQEEILDDFPYLTKEDILACLAYAADRERFTLTVQG